MFNNFNPFKLPTYKEIKEQTEKFWQDFTQIYKDWFSDVEDNLKK